MDESLWRLRFELLLHLEVKRRARQRYPSAAI
jgi:hypothetical protein